MSKFRPLATPTARPHRCNVRLSNEERKRAQDVIRKHAWNGVRLSLADALRIALMATSAIREARDAAAIEARP